MGLSTRLYQGRLQRDLVLFAHACVLGAQAYANTCIGSATAASGRAVRLANCAAAIVVACEWRVLASTRASGGCAGADRAARSACSCH